MAKFYYGDAFLPEIPTADGCEYAFIRKNISAGLYYAVLVKEPMYRTRDVLDGVISGASYEAIWYTTPLSGNEPWTYVNTSSTHFSIDADRVLVWANHDVRNGSATATDVYLAGSNPAPVAETAQEYIVNDGGWFVSGGSVTMDVDEGTLVKYLFPIKNGVVYTFKSLEAHNRLHVMVTTADMSVVTGTVSGTMVGTDSSNIPAGNIFTYQSTLDGWLCAYMSNAGEKPAVEILAYEPVGLRVRQHLEAEDGVLSGGAIVADRLSVSGNIVVDMITSSGGSLTLDFIAPVSDFYVIHMGATFSSTRAFKYTVNGKVYKRSITGTTYYGVEFFDFPLYLNAGSNTIVFQGDSTTYAPMFDFFEICSYAVGYEEGEVADCFNLRNPLLITVGQSIDMESDWLRGFDANALRRAYITYQYNGVDEYLGCTDALYNEADKSYQLTFQGYQNSLGSVRIVATMATTSITVDSIEATNHSDSWADVSSQFNELTLQLLEPCGAVHANCFTPAGGINVAVGHEAAVAEKMLKKITLNSLLCSFVTFQKNSAEYSMGCVNAVDRGFHGYELTFVTYYATFGALRVKFYIDEIGTVVRSIEADSNTGTFADVTNQFNGITFVLNLLEATTKRGNAIAPVVTPLFTFDFLDANWRTAYPQYYSVADSNGFYTASTFQYNGKNTLRSYAIGNSGTSKTEITFKLVTAGSIAFNYCITSENNYDWLTINIDGTQVVRKSGSVTWTDYEQNLSAGTHTLTLLYTKDGSGATSPDAGAIGYLNITGLYIPYEFRYLVRSESVVYAIEDGALLEITSDAVTSLLFRIYGGVEAPSSELVRNLPNPNILIWSDSNEFTTASQVIMTAKPYHQTLESPDYDMSDDTILGIEKAVVEANDSVQFAVSFNGGITWMTYVNNVWAQLSENASGMSAATLNSITTESWNEVATTGKIRFRVSLMDESSEFTSLIVDYLNEAEDSA